MAEQKTKARENSRVSAIEEVKGELSKCSPKCDNEDSWEGRHVLLIVNAIAMANKLRKETSDEKEILKGAVEEGMRVAIIGSTDAYKDRYVDFDAKMEGAATLLVDDTDLALKAARAFVDARVAKLNADAQRVKKLSETEGKEEVGYYKSILRNAAEVTQQYKHALALIEETAEGAKFFNMDKRTVRHA